MIIDNILQAIGHIPVVKFQRIAAHVPATVYGKCEFLNPGGSCKDRVALRMVEDAEAAGTIKPGDTLVEPSSGNTGIGLAMVGAVKGYNVVITLSEKVSLEKQRILESLGATVYRAPDVAWDAPNSNIMLAKRLLGQLPNAHMLNQYDNPSNSACHYEDTAAEIIADFPDGLDMVVMGVGTGGTITGVAKRLREYYGDIQIIGVDPNGYDFHPEILDNSVIDRYIKVDDKDAFATARQLIKQEGLLVGGSCGAAVCAALQAAATLQADQRCLVILPDTVRNYLSKFIDENWLATHGMLDETLEEVV